MSEETISTEVITDEEIEAILQETSELEEKENPFAKKFAKKSDEDEDGEEEDEDSEEEGDEEEEEEDEDEKVKESKILTKPAMVRAIFNQLQDTTKSKLESRYDGIMQALSTLEEGDVEEGLDPDPKSKDDPDVPDPKEVVASVKKAEKGTSKVKDGKKDKGESTKLKKEDVDFSDDIAALFNNETDLSEEFKSKATTIFEAALISKVNDELEKIENKFNGELNEAREENLIEMTEKVDEYLSYAVEEWQKENELAITKGLQAEVSEDFITGLRNLFAENYIEIPDEKIDVADTLADRVDKLESELNESIGKTIEMHKQINEYEKAEILSSVSDGLADTEIEKLKDLSEGVDFEAVEQYTNALGTLKENYFPKTGKAPQAITEEQETDGGVISETTGTMSAYTGAIDRTVRK